MANERNEKGRDSNPRDMNTNRLEGASSRPNDLPDSPRDEDKLRPEETYIDLPDVKDIPGQEFIQAPPAGMLADTTISSDDEEGKSVFDQEEDEDLRSGNEADVSRSERATLARAGNRPSTDEVNLDRARLDNVDFQNERLNERGFGEERSGQDLDIPGDTDETRSDDMGSGDEENRHFSLGSSDNDNITEGTP